jgi:monoterpene epsilon-lactone hydrolase
MTRARTYFINFLLRRIMKRRYSACRTPSDVRKLFESGPSIVPKGVRFTEGTIGGVSGEWVELEGLAARGTLVYLHGGGYVCMSPRTHRAITAGFALRGMRVFAPDYRLAPEHKFPAAVDDATAVWRALRAQVAGPIFIAGDSAGGGLSLALMLNLRACGERGPDAACLFSPWTDLACTGDSMRGNSNRDPLLNVGALHMQASAYASEVDLQTPLISPLYGDLAGLPPMIVFVGDTEILFNDSTRVAERARAGGVPVDLRTYHNMPHVWPMLNVILPEGREALDQGAAFLFAATPSVQPTSATAAAPLGATQLKPTTR